MTIQLQSDLPIGKGTFAPELMKFEVAEPGSDVISIRLHFFLPDLQGASLGRVVYRRPPWAIYRQEKSWIYLGFAPKADDFKLQFLAIFNEDHSMSAVYANRREQFIKGQLRSLTLLPTDQIFLARVLADRGACIFHSAAAMLHERGLLFLGDSGAGKTTIAAMLKEKAEIICDERNIVRRWPDRFRIHGTWMHSKTPVVSSSSSPLNAVMFLRKSNRNRVNPIRDRREIVRNLLKYVIKSLVSADWWNKTIDLMESMSNELPFYEMEFDMSGSIADELEELVGSLSLLEMRPDSSKEAWIAQGAKENERNNWRHRLQRGEINEEKLEYA
jgi:hypothetical protein